MATQPSTFANDKLPFEILGVIFQHCSQYTSFDYPLETLLLICRTWLDAALGHQSLWATFGVQIDHERDFIYWKHAIPRRILRFTTNIPLDIDICAKWTCSMDDVIAALAGESGRNVQRWRRFMVDVGVVFSSKPIIQWLSLPTPNLEYFEISGHNLGTHKILPHAPLLKRFSVKFFGGPYPDLRKVTTILIAGGRTIDNEALLKAENVITLGIEGRPGQCKLPQEFPFLQNLLLRGIVTEELLDGFSAPNLCRLSLRLRKSHFESITSWRGLHLHRLRELSLGWWPVMRRSEFMGLRNGLNSILDAAPNVRILVALDDGMARIILTLLGEFEHHNMRNFVFKYRDCTMELKHGEQREIGLNAFRQATGLPVKASWDALYDDLKKKFNYTEVEAYISRPFDIY